MKKYWDNLRPFERRVVVVVAATVFVVFNAWFVFPHFSDWNKVKNRIREAQFTKDKYLTEMKHADGYKKDIAKLMGGQGQQDVPAEEQASQFSRIIQQHQAQSGVNVTSTGRINNSTNQFFLELSQNIGVQSTEQQLVDFLYELGSGASLIRVRDISLHTDPPRQQLVANVRLVASYQKAPPKRPAAGGRAAPSTASK